MKCIFCDFTTPHVDVLCTHSATCDNHPAVKRAKAAEALCAELRDAAEETYNGSVDAAGYPDGPCLDRETRQKLNAALAKTPADMGAELVRLRAQVALDERTKAAMLRGGLQEREALRARVAEQEAAWDEQLKNVERLTERAAALEHDLNMANKEYAACSELLGSVTHELAVAKDALRVVFEFAKSTLADNGAAPDTQPELTRLGVPPVPDVLRTDLQPPAAT
jgi:hypothetical protein